MDDMEKMRDRLHDLADKLSQAVTRTEVTAAKLEGVTAMYGPIAKKVDDHTDRILVLETRSDDSRAAGAKWGAGLGAFTAALISGITAIFGGGK